MENKGIANGFLHMIASSMHACGDVVCCETYGKRNKTHNFQQSVD